MDQLSSLFVEVGDLFRLVWNIFLAFPPIVVLVCLGWIKLVENIQCRNNFLILVAFFWIGLYKGCLLRLCCDGFDWSEDFTVLLELLLKFSAFKYAGKPHLSLLSFAEEVIFVFF